MSLLEMWAVCLVLALAASGLAILVVPIGRR